MIHFCTVGNVPDACFRCLDSDMKLGDDAIEGDLPVEDGTRIPLLS